MKLIGHVGFTGTQKGMAAGQAGAVRAQLWKCATEGGLFFHHGDCVGADEQAHELSKEFRYAPIIHPPKNPAKRAFCFAPMDDMREPKDYLARNKDIVRESHVMIAAPAEYDEQLRSGTWSTIRYAEKLGRPVIIVFPDGSLRGIVAKAMAELS